MESSTGDTERAMSEENVEAVRKAYAIMAEVEGPAAQRGDYDDIYLDYFTDDLEVVLPPIYPDADPVYVGLDGYKRWLRQMDEAFDHWGFEPERFLDAGSQGVLVYVRTSATAKHGGVAVTIPAAHVCTVRNGRIARVVVFLDRAQALEAAGLPE
jgi:ketosteroid isomerase-like protein